MAERDPWATLISVAGAAGAAAGIVSLAGGVVLSLRYEGLGLSGQQAVDLTPREVLLFAGARSLLLWWLAGLAVVLLLLRSCRGSAASGSGGRGCSPSSLPRRSPVSSSSALVTAGHARRAYGARGRGGALARPARPAVRRLGGGDLIAVSVEPTG